MYERLRWDGRSLGRAPVRKGGSSSVQIEHEIVGRPAFSEVIVYLPEGAEVISEAGAMQWMRGAVDRGAIEVGGVVSAFWRSSGGESAILNRFVGKASNGAPGCVCFASPFPGDILPLTLQPGATWKLSRGSFIACSDNVAVSGKLNWQGRRRGSRHALRGSLSTTSSRRSRPASAAEFSSGEHAVAKRG